MDLEKVDFLTEIDSLRRGWQACQARLAAVEAERDAARAKRDAARAEVAHMKREQQAMIMQHRHDIRDLGELLQDERCKVAAVEAERDAARAGEARAVAALQNLRIPLAQLGDFMYSPVRDASQELLAIVNSVLANTYTQPAIDWLAQQRREAAAEALEGIGAKQTSASTPAAQKVETLIFLADTADKLARLDCELIDRAAIAQRAALFRECAAMMRERGESGWAAQFEREYKGKTLAVVEAGPIGWYWYVDGSADYEAEIAPTLAAAQAAAVAWVDEQEGK